MLFNPMRTRRGVTALAAVGAALAVAGCGGSDSESKNSTKAAEDPNSQERYATVLDEAVEKSKDELPAVDVDLGGGKKVSFKEGEPLKVAFFGYGKGFDYSIPQYEGAEKEAEKYGIELDAFDTAADAQKEVTQIQDAMNSGKYNAAIVYPLSPDLDCNLITEQLPEKNILPVAIGQPGCTDEPTSEGLLTSVPDTGASEGVYDAWAEEIGKAEKGKKAIFLTGPKLDFISDSSVAAAEKVFPKHDVEILATLRTDYTTPDSLQKAQDALQAHPDAEMIISAYPEGTQGALTAARVAGKTDMPIYDFGSAHKALGQIQDGKVKGSTPFYPYTKVKTAIQALILARRGQQADVPDYLPYSGHAVESLRPEGAGAMFVTPETAEQFQKLLAEF
jgi:ribose transport system substrate-binding protein